MSELALQVPVLRCCRTALIEGMHLAGGGWPQSGDAPATGAGELLVQTTRSATARLALSVLHADGVRAHIHRERAPRRQRWEITEAPAEAGAGLVRHIGSPGFAPTPLAAGVPTQARRSRAPHCDQALLRGAFLQAGWVGRPDDVVHFEIVAADEQAAATLVDAFARRSVRAVVARRRNRPVVLVRSSDGVAAALSQVGASGGRLRFEDGRVVREVRAGVSRRLNSETANLRRTVHAAHRQADVARRLQGDEERWRCLPPAVRDAALMRLRHPVASLSHLASRAGVSRSAMADRLRRLEAVDAVALELRDRSIQGRAH